jgi:hypothetical protein
LLYISLSANDIAIIVVIVLSIEKDMLILCLKKDSFQPIGKESILIIFIPTINLPGVPPYLLGKNTLYRACCKTRLVLHRLLQFFGLRPTKLHFLAVVVAKLKFCNNLYHKTNNKFGTAVKK